MTAQAHEIIMIDDALERMATCPELPVYSSQILELHEDEIARVFNSSACWRQYVGTWKISDNKLYLIGVEGKYNLSENKPIFTYWFSGLLKIQQGNILKYVHAGYASTYERELHITVEKGLVTKKVNFKNQKPSPPVIDDIPL
jgi:hypothetical protein